MDYQEAINRHIEECKHRIDVITDFMEANRDADKDKCLENIEIFKTAISAMKELQEYKQKLNESYGECDGLLKTVVDGLVRHEGIDIGKPIKSRILTDEHVDLWEGYKQLGALEEVREAVEKQNECKNCGYKIHSERISKLNSCNDCGLKNTCVKRPEYGDYCRINCYDWSEKNE